MLLAEIKIITVYESVNVLLVEIQIIIVYNSVTVINIMLYITHRLVSLDVDIIFMWLFY